MDNNQIVQLEKRNFYLRIGIMAMLIVIALLVLYFRFGYTDPDDIGLIDRIGRNVSCKQAMEFYIAEKWGYEDAPLQNNIYNISNITFIE